MRRNIVNQELLEKLRKITPEEEEMLKKKDALLEDYIAQPGSDVVDKDRMLREKRMIDIMKQPRFVSVPEHTHNYIEMVYICSGSAVHTINGTTKLKLETDDLLLLKPGTYHAYGAAGYDDIIVRFIVLPEFMQYPLGMMNEDTVMRRFVQAAAEGRDYPDPYLHFHLQDMQEAKNLLENMILSLQHTSRNGRRILQATLGVLLLELSSRTYTLTVGTPSSYEQQLVIKALSYVEDNYKTASLEGFCRQEDLPAYYISRLMKKYSPYTFTKYLQRRRLLEAAQLLSETDEPIEQIIVNVGYENSSHFHRLFREEFKMTPKEYRKKYLMDQ